MYTDRIIPSLLMGTRIDKVEASLDGRLLYVDPKSGRWQVYDPDPSLFGMAYREGWNPAVAGWYNPYCRVFGTVLAQCSWRPYIGDTIFPESSEQSSVLTNALAFPQHYLKRALLHSASTPMPEDEQRWISNYQSIMQSSAELIENGNLRFLFLHMPVPHPPGIYDGRNHEFRNSGSYLDNLALADDTMGKLLEEIEDSPLASETTVIVSSDHSWRVPVWKGGPQWTAEEQSVSRGLFESRPVFLVHYPAQTTGIHISEKKSEIIEHDIIAAMLRDELKDPQELNRFVAAASR